MCAYNRVFARPTYNRRHRRQAYLPECTECTNHCPGGLRNASNVGRYGFLGCTCQICEDLGSCRRGLSCWNASAWRYCDPADEFHLTPSHSSSDSGSGQRKKGKAGRAIHIHRWALRILVFEPTTNRTFLLLLLLNP